MQTKRGIIHSIVAAAVAVSCGAAASDLQLTTLTSSDVYDDQYVVNADGGSVPVKKDTDQATKKTVYSVNQPAVLNGITLPKDTLLNDKQAQQVQHKPKCVVAEGAQSFCWQGYAGSENGSLLNDVTALPLAASAQSIKLTVYQYTLYLGDNLPLPFKLASGAVANSENVSSSNKLLLLDPDQGTVNFAFGGVGKFRLGPLCSFVEKPGACTVGLTAGARYMDLHKQTSGDGTQGKGAFGGYATASLGLAFPIIPGSNPNSSTMKAVSPNLQSNDTGVLAFKLGATYFAQNSSDSSGQLFPDAKDVAGNPITVKGHYGEYGGTVALNLPLFLTLNASYFHPIGNTAIGNSTTVSITYNFGKATDKSSGS